MKSLPTLSPKLSLTRIAPLFLAALCAFSVEVPKAAAADALTTAASGAVGKGFLGSLLQRKSAAVDATTAPPPTGMDRVNRSILGLPLNILRGLGRGVSRVASKTVTDHVTHN